MSCLNPITIRNKRYQAMTRKEMLEYMFKRIGLENCVKMRLQGDDILCYYPPDYFLKVPCGKCSQCKKSFRQKWSIRLLMEMQCYKENSFVTLTLDDENHKKFLGNPKVPLKLYIDRLRKHLGYRPKYFFVSELGDEKHHTGRLHYHGIFFNTSKEKFCFADQRSKWKLGHVWIGYCNFKTAHYLAKYMLKQKDDFKPFVMCSNGIGSSYVTKHNFYWHLNNFDFRQYIIFNHRFYPLPEYYSNKFFNDDIKLVKMLNRVKNPQKEYYLNGRTFTNPLLYDMVRSKYYKLTLKLGLSTPLSLKNYGKFCISQSKIKETETEFACSEL